MVAVPSWHYEEAPEASGAVGGKMPVALALTKCYDLRSPKAELLAALWAAVPEAIKARRPLAQPPPLAAKAL